jgi:hypothetical protein
LHTRFPKSLLKPQLRACYSLRLQNAIFGPRAALSETPILTCAARKLSTANSHEPKPLAPLPQKTDFQHFMFSGKNANQSHWFVRARLAENLELPGVFLSNARLSY